MRRVVLVCAVAATVACQDRGEREKVAKAPAPALTSEPRNDDAQTGAAPGATPSLPTDVRDVEGTVARASAREVVIRPTDGDAVALRVDPETPVRVDGEVSRAERIPQGSRVRASYTFEDGDPRAVRIEAERSGK